ncbi:DUF1641 domain-containing protein [Halomicrococcus sp. SG-WS-1]|uniref:DUF1641 domain-containing protein n=1 Tax=Halomicrococcus sp. SG-WS-1 TaxID=3439057 RepID=UPI003F7A0605
MSETTGETPETLEDAVAENPEAVADFVRRLDLVNELLDATELAVAAADDEMVSGVAATSASLAEAADGLATRETAQLSAAVGENGDDLASALETVVELERSGALDELAAVADVLPLLSGALDDEMVASLARTGGRLGEVADAAGEPETARGAETLLDAVGEVGRRDDSPEPVGPAGLVRAMGDPEVKRGIGVVLAMVRSLGESAGAQEK